MLLGPDLLSAVLGWDCHTHRCYGPCRRTSREDFTDAEKVTQPRCCKCSGTEKCLRMGWSVGGPLM